MRVDVACGDRESGSNLALNSKAGLLRIRIPKVRLVDENHLKRRKWAAIGNIEAELGHPARAGAGGNASIVSSGGCCAGDRPLREQRLENRSRIQPCIAAGYSRERHDIDRDFAVA